MFVDDDCVTMPAGDVEKRSRYS